MGGAETVSTWVPGTAPGDGLEGLVALRPDLVAPYRDFVARLWRPEVMDPVVLELCRLRVAATVGCTAELAVRTAPALDAGLTEAQVAALGTWRAGGFDEDTAGCLSFAEQFSVDAGSIDAAERAALAGRLGMRRLVGLVNALAVFDGFDRMRLVLGVGRHGGHGAAGGRAAVVDPGRPDPRYDAAAPALDADDPAVAFSGAQPGLFAAFGRLYGVLWRQGVVDHPSKEVARLRNARVTGCRFCRNVRFDQARRDGLGEDQVALIADGYEASALPDAHKAVIAFADVFLTDPAGGVPAPLRASMLEHYGPAGVVELSVALALFLGFSKIAVALGAFPHDFETTVIPTPDLAPEPG